MVYIGAPAGGRFMVFGDGSNPFPKSERAGLADSVSHWREGGGLFRGNPIDIGKCL